MRFKRILGKKMVKKVHKGLLPRVMETTTADLVLIDFFPIL